MRTLHITETAQGGVGTYIRLLTARLSAEFGADSVLVVAPSENIEPLAGLPAAQLAGFSHAGRSPLTFLRLARLAVTSARAHRPDIIHLHSSFAGAIGRTLGVLGLLQRPLVYCAHGWAFLRQAAPWKIRAAILLERRLAPACDAIVAISDHEYQAACHAGLPRQRLRLVTNGVEAAAPEAQAAAWDDPRLRVLFVGRLDRQKGFDLLAQAAAARTDRISVRIVGAAVVDALPRGELPANVQLLGWLSPQQVQQQLLACDVVVIPSRWEGFGLVALEAMRAGRAVIAAPVGGLAQIVRHGSTGLLLEAVSAQALQNALAGTDRAALAAMGAAGRRVFLDHYTFEKTYWELLRVYRDAAANTA